MRIHLNSLFTAVVVLGVAGLCAAAVIIMAGWYNVAALDPHPAPITRFLHGALRQSVKNHAQGIKVPDLGDPALAGRAAGQFDAVCAECHGAPGVPRGQSGQAMYPQAPDLSATAHEWTAAELFWVIKYGIKLSGMPAWGPTHRDDEIWAFVALIRRLPDMTPEDYRRLADAAWAADPDAIAGDAIARAGASFTGTTACARCHGVDGAGLPGGGIPRIAGLDAAYLETALDHFAIGLRRSGIMEPVARALTPGQRRAVAAHYAGAAAAPPPARPAGDAALLELGRSIATAGRPDRAVPSCASCHGPGRVLEPGVPAIAGQFADYMTLQFDLWRTGSRGAGPEGGIMQRLALVLSPREIEAVSLYYASLRADGEQAAADRILDPAQ